MNEYVNPHYLIELNQYLEVFINKTFVMQQPFEDYVHQKCNSFEKISFVF